MKVLPLEMALTGFNIHEFFFNPKKNHECQLFYEFVPFFWYVILCEPLWTSQDICSFPVKPSKDLFHSEMKTRLLLFCRALLFLSACPSCPITPHYSVPECWTCSWKLLMRAESWEAAAKIFDVLQFVHNSSLLDRAHGRQVRRWWGWENLVLIINLLGWLWDICRWAR